MLWIDMQVEEYCAVVSERFGLLFCHEGALDRVPRKTGSRYREMRVWIELVCQGVL